MPGPQTISFFSYTLFIYPFVAVRQTPPRVRFFDGAKILIFFLANKNSIFLTKQVIVARNDFSQLPRQIGCCLFAGVAGYARKNGGQDAGKRLQAAGERAGKRRNGKVCVVMTGMKGKAIHALYAVR